MPPTAFRAPDNSDEIVEVLKAVASPLTGDAFLHNLVEQLGTLFRAETTFVARRPDPQSTKVRGLAAWKDGSRKEAWDFDLKDNPCHLVYGGQPIYLPCDVAEKFEGKRGSGYQSFVGYPLCDDRDEVIGHIAVYSSKALRGDDEWLALCSLFADRAQAEIRRQQVEEERERAIAKLKELDALKNEFISVAAHDLRSPLGAVRGIAETLGRAEIDRERQKLMFGSIVKASDRMIELVNRYLDVAAIEAGSLKIEKIDADLASVIDERVALRRLIAAERNIAISADCPAGLTCRIDPDRLGQVIDNLLDNAIKFSPDGGTVEVHAGPAGKGERIAITVSDGGPGIPEDMRERIFQPFETSGTSADRPAPVTGKSFGLGLMISKRVVDAHGGSITVSESPAGGACITVEIPRM